MPSNSGSLSYPLFILGAVKNDELGHYELELICSPDRGTIGTSF